ncbi:hypothetical protein GCM10008957_01790 [Deinococcus ruber]|uniref:Uncharacterized protein n=1 Tax=Deinococcus ruber TaxID=1848197 RepID=A0A918BW46_9DEIO|nr:hypothetical protein GCM10008957_01790 [Deinococcus ruber]
MGIVGAAVWFLWHCPSASHVSRGTPASARLLAAQPLAGILPCGARTFLTRKGATMFLPALLSITGQRATGFPRQPQRSCVSLDLRSQTF